MGRLSGFRYREVVAKLRKSGFVFDRQAAGSHEIWRHPLTLTKVTVPHHAKPIAEGTLRAIIREAGIDTNEFLRL